MDAFRFDSLTRRFASSRSRRSALLTLATTIVGALPAAARDKDRDPDDVHASAKCAGVEQKCGKRKGKGKKKKGKKARKCCSGFACQGGRCRCGAGLKPCSGSCIPQSECCAEADCDGRACLDGVCQPCLPGQKLCLLSCIPEDECCPGCFNGAECQNGECVCPAGTTECSNGVCRANGPDGCCGDFNCTGRETCQGGVCRCPTGTIEIHGTCTQTCTSAAQCPTDFCSCSSSPEFPNVCTVLTTSCDSSDETCDQNSECFDIGLDICAFVGCADGRGRCTNACPLSDANRSDDDRRDRNRRGKDRR